MLFLVIAGGCAPEEVSTPAPPPHVSRNGVRKVTEGNDFKPFTDRAAWKARVRYLREQQLVACGLWPFPERCPLNPVVTKTIDRGDYVVENLYFASLPGFYVTGSLFRPKGKGPYAGILCTHGHDRKGRFQEGPEKTRDGKPNLDRHPYQARCITLARLGCVAFLYDMVGYADSTQVRHPPDMPPTRLPEGAHDLEGFECEQYLLSTMGLQTWNSMRAVDYLLSRPDVDPARIAVTGESGGATQTLMLMMTDDRLACAAPVCMVSTGFQGDCTCEQAALGKIGTDTVEFCAAFAPKPLIVVSATGDWTKEMIEKGGPEIRSTYELMGAADRVSIVRFEAPHNYNRTSREAVYAWFNRWLKLGHAEPIVEPPFEPIDPKELAVFDPQHPRPADALDAKSLKAQLIQSAGAATKRMSPDELRTALRHMLASDFPMSSDVDVKPRQKNLGITELIISRKDEDGKTIGGLVGSREHSGVGVVIVGASVTSEPYPRNELVLWPMFRNEKPGVTSVGFYPCFNRTLLAERVHDILTSVAYVKSRPGIKSVDLVGLGQSGPACLLARALCGDAVRRTVIENAGFSFASVKSVDDPMYLPGALRYGDLAGLSSLVPQGSDRLKTAEGKIPPAEIVDWLTRP